MSKPLAERRPLSLYVSQLTPRLCRMARFYARYTRVEESDLLQEAYVGLIEAWQRLDESIGVPSQYLIRHARWRLLCFARRSRVRNMPRLPEDVASSDLDLRYADLRIDLAFARMQLKPFQRAVIDCLAEGLTWREAGERLSCTSANIAYHMRQIRRHLV